jgi:hypothetical protein
MALESASKQLRSSLQVFKDTLESLRLTVETDAPDSHILVDRFTDALDDLLGWLDESLARVTKDQATAQHAALLAQQALFCQERHNHMTQRLYGDLMSYKWLQELSTLGHERKGEWQAWVSSIKKTLGRCHHALHSVGQALFACWQEVVEHLGGSGVALHTTNIGQQITVPLAKK